MSKLCEYIYKTALIILGICTAYVFIMSIFGKKSVYDYSPLILVIGTIIYLGVYIIIHQYCKKIDGGGITCIAITLISIYFILAIIMGLRIKSERPADIFNLHYAAVSYLETGQIANVNYFSVYSMQLTYTYFLIGVYKLGKIIGIGDYRTSGTIAGAVMLLVSLILVYKTACKIKDKRLGISAVLIYICNPIFYIYSSYYYTDLIGMVLLLSVLYLAIAINQSHDTGKQCILCVLMGFLTVTGYKMRAVVAIGGIAAFLLYAIKFSRNGNRKELFRYSFMCFAGAAGAYILLKMADMHFCIELDKNKQFPIAHWLMMGFSNESNGRWSQELYNYTAQLPTYDEKIAGNIDAIKTSFHDMGIAGICKLFLRKICTMWSDGMTALTTNFTTAIHYGKLYEYTIGNRRAATCYITQILRSALLLSVIPYIFSEFRSKFSKKSLLTVAFFGYFAFYLLWEVHEKYVLMFLPVLVIMGAYGMEIFIGSFGRLKEVWVKADAEYVVNKQKIYFFVKRAVGVISLMTLVLYLVNWRTFTSDTEKYYNFRVYQSTMAGTYEIGESIIRQTFLAEDNFNAVYIRLKKSGAPNGQVYTFRLYTEEGNCIYEGRFMSEDVPENSYYPFCFNEVEIGKCQRFYFELGSDDIYEKNIEVFCAGNNGSDYYANGICSIGGEKKGDLTFRVYDIQTESYYTKAFYAILAGISLLLEGAVYAFAHKKAAEG